MTRLSMTTRHLPSPDTFASCPLDGKILEHYAGTFEAVYVSFNPFIEPVSIDKTEFKTGAWPSPSIIAANCKPIFWSEIARLTELPSLAAVDIGLRTSIQGLRKDLENPEYSAAIATLRETHGILQPSEGTFPELLINQVLQAIQGLGYEWLWIGNEFDTERKLEWIDDLKNEMDRITLGRFNLFTPDKQLLWTIHWDSHFSFLCSSREKLAAIHNAIDLEGFFCDPSTEVYWSVHS
jgi:hypothetical protein